MYRKPFRSRICRNVDLDEVSAVQPDNHEAIEQLKVNGAYNEQIHCSDICGVILQKGMPSLAWRSTPLEHVFDDA